MGADAGVTNWTPGENWIFRGENQVTHLWLRKVANRLLNIGTILFSISALPFNWGAGVMLPQHSREKNEFSAGKIRFRTPNLCLRIFTIWLLTNNIIFCRKFWHRGARIMCLLLGLEKWKVLYFLGDISKRAQRHYQQGSHK